MSRPPSPPPHPAGAALLLMLTLGGLVAAAAVPSLRMLAAPLGGVLLIVGWVLITVAALRAAPV